MGILLLSMLVGAAAAAASLMAGQSWLIALLAYSGCGVFCALTLTFLLPAARHRIHRRSSTAKGRAAASGKFTRPASEPESARARSS